MSFHLLSYKIRADWKKGERPSLLNQWQYHFEEDTCGCLYTKNLLNELKGTVWQYCPIAGFYSHFHEPMQALVSEYRDYLDMCHKMGYDMKNSFVLYPKDLQKSHDRTARRMKHKEDAKIKRNFIAVYRRLSGQHDSTWLTGNARLIAKINPLSVFTDML